MKYANLYFITVIFLCSAAMASFALAEKPRQNIFPIGSQAVYILDEACTVNMTPSREEEAILADMLECVELHRQHR